MSNLSITGTSDGLASSYDFSQPQLIDLDKLDLYDTRAWIVYNLMRHSGMDRAAAEKSAMQWTKPGPVLKKTSFDDLIKKLSLHNALCISVMNKSTIGLHVHEINSNLFVRY